MGVPLNGAGFQTETPYDGVEPNLFFSLPPMMLAALVLLGLALFALGWFLRDGSSSRRTDDADGIWKAIDDAVKAAMKADGAALSGKASALKDVIHSRLGRTLALAGGLSELTSALDDALAGKPHTPHAHGGHDAHAAHDAHGDDHHADTPAPEAKGHASITQVTIINGGRDEGHTSHDKPHEPGHLSPRERDRALRLAVADLNDHWGRKSERIAGLRAAHRELSAG